MIFDNYPFLIYLYSSIRRQLQFQQPPPSHICSKETPMAKKVELEYCTS